MHVLQEALDIFFERYPDAGGALEIAIPASILQLAGVMRRSGNPSIAQLPFQRMRNAFNRIFVSLRQRLSQTGQVLRCLVQEHLDNLSK